MIFNYYVTTRDPSCFAQESSGIARVMQYVHEGNNVDRFSGERNMLAVKWANWNMCRGPDQDIDAFNFDVWPIQSNCFGNRAVACADIENLSSDRNFFS